MKHLFQLLLLAFFAATTLVLSSCGDDKKTDPVPTTGTINGQITPANSVTTVTATSTATPVTTITVTPNASGAYTLPNLTAGTYTLSFTPATGFAAPATQTVTVTAGGTTTATPVTVTVSVGTINGQITPANSVTTVTATSTATPATTVTATPNASGAYTFSNLTAGTYTLSFTPAAGFTAPATQTVTVTAGGTTTATPVMATMGTSFTYTINGTATTDNQTSANAISGFLLIQSISNTGSRIVTLGLDPMPTSARSYTFGGTSSTSEIYITEVAGSSVREWSTTTTGGSGTVTITSVSMNPRRVSGTFSAVAQPDGVGTTGTRTITAGTFSNLAF